MAELLTPIGVSAVAVSPVRGATDASLPEGWDIAEYSGVGGRPQFAVYANGRRLASGMTSAGSASRWAQLLAASSLWPAA